MANNKVENITLPAALKYAALPGIIPRIVEFWQTGFATVAALIAQIFLNIGLLPMGHTYLQQKNFGKYSIVQVILAAQSNLKFTRKHIDQVIIFGLICFAFILIALQLFALLMAIIMPGVFAQGLFTTPNPTNDIAFVMLDRIFGVPLPATAGATMGFFGSCVGDSANVCTALRYDGNNSAVETIPVPLAFPWSFHLALHQLFAFFSYTIAAVSLFIVLYFVAAVILESIQSGTPFGKRFSKLWAPLRLIMAFALIVPISNGLNLAQYGVLYSAKWGSSLATNVWHEFNAQAANNGLMDPNSLVGKPVANDAMEIIAFTHIANLCQNIETQIFPRRKVVENFGTNYNKEIGLYLINHNTNNRQAIIGGTGGYQDYAAADAFSGGGDITIRVGSLDPAVYAAAGDNIEPAYARHAGSVRPYCGEIIIPAVNTSSAGAALIREKYYDFIVTLWVNGGAGYSAPTCPDTTVSANGPAWLGARIQNHADSWADHWFKNQAAPYAGAAIDVQELKADGSRILLENLNCIIEAAVDAERAQLGTNNSSIVPQPLLDRGWAGAGIFYNRIAEINSTLIDAVNNVPQIHAWPLTMQRVAKARRRNEPSPIQSDLFDPDYGSFEAGTLLPRNAERDAARSYSELYKLWALDGAGTGGRNSSGNTFESAIAWIFGIQGLYSMTDNTTDNVHPLAKLSGLGKSLMESSIRNITLGAGGMVGDLAVGADNPMSATMDFAGQFGSALVSAASITLTAGFILFYIVPMLPFMYFFFAVGTWIKTVFEAMIGVPLWALAHIHIEGGGLPGQKAANGYYLLFEIFVRPVMIVMGFLASITIFSAMSNVLIDVWDIVIANVGGATPIEENTANFADAIRGPVDKMFYLVMFTMLLYMIGVSSFKLVDQIPQSILRWVGASVPTFVDQKDDITSSLVSRTAMAANKIFGDMAQGLQGKYAQRNMQQDQQVVAKYALEKPENLPAHVQYAQGKLGETTANKIIHAEVAKALQPYAGKSLPEIPASARGLVQDLRDRFPEVANKLRPPKD